MTLTFSDLSIELDDQDLITQVNHSEDHHFVGQKLNQIPSFFENNNAELIHQYKWEMLIHQYYFVPEVSLREEVPSMLCRCVDVSYVDATTLLRDNADWGILDLCENLEVTAGCGRCTNDVKNLVSKMRDQRKTPLQMALEVQNSLERGEVLCVDKDKVFLSEESDLNFVQQKFPELSIQLGTSI